MMAFDVVDGRRRGAPSCAQLRYDPESRQWAITVSAGAGPEDVPMLMAPFVERGQREIGHEWAYRWVQERVVPSGRQNLGEVLRAHDLQEYDEFPLLASSRGASSQDYFVLRGPYELRGEGVMPDRRCSLREEIGRQLARARKEAGLTQAQLAERACMDQAVISRVERGRENVTANLLADLAEALGKQARVTLE